MKIRFLFQLLLLVSVLLACSRPEDKLVGTWEYDSFTIDDSGIGFLAAFLPNNWKAEIDEWLEKTKGLTNSVLEFNPDGTFKESFSGAAEKFTNVKGNFSVTPDFSEIRLRINDKEQVMHIEEFSESGFIYKKEFTQYEIPLTLNIKYVRKE
jgi:hypothetical protein